MKIRQQTAFVKTARRLAALLLAGCLVIALGLQPAAVSAATTSEALNEAKAKQAELAAQQEKLAKETKQLSADVDKLAGDLAWLNERSDEQKKLYQEKTAQLEAAVAELEQAYAGLVLAEQELLDKQDQYVARMQIMFEHQNQSVLQVFLEAKSLQGFFTTLQFMAIVADTDQQMLDELEEAKDNAILQRDLAKQHSEDMAVVVAQLESDIAILKADADAKQADLSQTELKLSAREQAEDALNAESEQVAAEVAELQKQLAAEQAAAATAAAKATQAAKATAAAKAAQAAAATAAAKANQPTPTPKPSTGGTTSNSKGWVWPYPGDRTVYSPYGMRYHPIYHTYRFHSGVDLGGDYGNPIVAATDGVVLLVRNAYEGSNTGGSGYGNYIVISHADGISTLYGHLKNTLVKVGQSVKAGDKIATCGSTGTSTGPHLHFEVMINGKTVNPVPYIS